MTPNQKIIKNCAIVFAACLIAGIVLVALRVIIGVFGAFVPNQKGNTNVVATEYEEEEQKIDTQAVYENVKNLKIKSGIYKLQIERDSSINKGVKVSLSNVSSDYKIKYKEESKTLETEDNDDIFHFWKDKDEISKGIITISVSDNTELDKVRVEMGVGTVTIEDIIMTEFDVKCGVGAFTCENVKAEHADIEGGVGSVRCDDVMFDGLEVEGGVGDIKVDGVLTGKTSVVAGMGAIELDINGKKKNYNLNVETGLGSIYIDGKKCSDIQESDNSQNNLLDVEGGIGSVKINFN